MFKKIKELNLNYCEKRRFNNTINYIKKTLQLHGKILDLGIENKLSERMQKEGSLVKNTNGKD